jgi:hypothetical protein
MGNFVQEFEPLADMKTFIESNWVNYPEAPTPEVQVVNDAEDTIAKIDVWDTDYLLITTGSEDIRPRGNFTYFDRVVQVQITAITKSSRQRLQNMYKELRSMVFINKHAFPNWQLIKPISHKEMVERDLNIWRADFIVQLENHCILADTVI